MSEYYGVFVLTKCPVCGRVRAQPMYRGEKLDLERCRHFPSALPIPQELILQRIPPNDGSNILNLTLKKDGAYREN